MSSEVGWKLRELRRCSGMSLAQVVKEASREAGGKGLTKFDVSRFERQLLVLPAAKIAAIRQVLRRRIHEVVQTAQRLEPQGSYE